MAGWREHTADRTDDDDGRRAPLVVGRASSPLRDHPALPAAPRVCRRVRIGHVRRGPGQAVPAVARSIASHTVDGARANIGKRQFQVQGQDRDLEGRQERHGGHAEQGEPAHSGARDGGGHHRRFNVRAHRRRRPLRLSRDGQSNRSLTNRRTSGPSGGPSVVSSAIVVAQRPAVRPVRRRQRRDGRRRRGRGGAMENPPEALRLGLSRRRRTNPRSSRRRSM